MSSTAVTGPPGLDIASSMFKISNAGNDAATEQLAKYHEHVIRDFETALWLSGRLADSEASRRRCSRRA